MKLEIRFLDGQRVYHLMQEAIHAALGGAARRRRHPATPCPGRRGACGAVPAMAAAGGETPRYFPAEPWPPEDDFRVLGQYLDSYIVVEKNGELLVIDQHNARERVLFERLQAGYRVRGAASAQALFPLLLELSPAEQAALDEGKMDFSGRPASISGA